MKPLNLTMTAFGPYKNKEVIDFSELKGNRLFVISGNTGAGKTTIFDAICFALYGSASGEDRNDAKLLRSHFARDDVHTAVEFEFELHQRVYRIKRQLPHVKKGNKTATGEQYAFYEKVDGKEIPCVERQIVSEINKKVEQLIGLTKDQFSQIVMLPQGEFQKLLTSQTENKEEILRKIFKTEPYRWISDRLKDKKREVETHFYREQEVMERFIHSIPTILLEREGSKLFSFLKQEYFTSKQIIMGLEDEVHFYQTELEIKKEKEEKTKRNYHEKLEAYHKADLINQQFKKLEEKQQMLQTLKEKIPYYKEKESQLERAEQASKIENVEKQVKEWRTEEQNKRSILERASVMEQKAKQELEQAKEQYKMEENKKSEREEITKRLHHYQEFIPIVKEMENRKKELSEMQKKVEMLHKNQEQVRKQIQHAKEEKAMLRQQIETYEKTVEQLEEKQQLLTDLRDRCRILQMYLKLAKEKSMLMLDRKKKEEEYLIEKEKYEQLEEAWLNGQARLLSMHLQDGEPCPVCGSTHHPKKALHQEAVPTKAELDVVKKQLEEKEKIYRHTLAKAQVNEEQLSEKETELTQLGIQVQQANYIYQQFVADGKKLNQEVSQLEKDKKKVVEWKKKLEKKETELERLETNYETIRREYQQLDTMFQTKKAVFQEQIGRIPQEIRSLTELKEMLAKIEALKTELETALKIAQTNLQQAQEKEAKTSTDVKHALSQLEETTKRKQQAVQQFQEALQKANFSSEEMYEQAKMREADRLQLKEEIEQFQQQYENICAQVKELQKELQGKQAVHMEQLTMELNEQKKAYEAAQELLHQTEQYLQKAQELKEAINDSHQKVTQLEKKLSVITDLYDVIRGQNNQKISFERYLQIEYLEQIISFANERLKRLSNGQFMLMRSERQENRGKQSGLGLDVYDAYTGQTRDVKTLSGGEKFNASLCLALGMADVIQSFQGGISIETMFIDEGFGSLDEESLHKAIDTLIDLQKSGRIIGVISHVQELKQLMPAIIEVEKTKEGYSHAKIIVK